MHLVALDPPGPHAKRRWRCQCCGLTGLTHQMMGPERTIDCTYVYPPCEACGGTPECMIDCPLMAKALRTPGVRVIGEPSKTRDA
jgi:hypothetical protein